MPGKKGGGNNDPNSKKAQGNARKAEAAAAKQAAADARVAAAESAQWAQGAKSTPKKQEDAAAKKAEAAAKKAERDRLLAEEEASQPSKPKGANKKVAEKRTNKLDLAQLDEPSRPSAATAISASGIDNALDALSLTDSTSAIKLERHPERRFKAAYESFEARRLPELIAENKGSSSLRRNQMVEMVRKEFERAPENPFNQTERNVRHNATRDELGERREEIRSAVETRLGEK